MTERWNQQILGTLLRYHEEKLRQVAHKLCKPRNQWPVEELLDRLVSALGNAAMIDRRLKELPAVCRQILCVIGKSRQARWPVGSLVEILVALGAKDGLAPLVTLLESGLLLPDLCPAPSLPDNDKINARFRLKDFEGWLARSQPAPMLLASPMVTRRVANEDLGIECPTAVAPAKDAAVHEADGLEWPLRLAVIWQQMQGAPLRRTQQGDYFKRDLDRLQSDPLLGVAPTDALAPIPDPSFFVVALASGAGLLHQKQSELHASDWPELWKSPLPPLVAELWASLGRMSSWNPATGHSPSEGLGNPYPSAYLLALLVLAHLNEKQWAAAQDVEDAVTARHPFWLSKCIKSPGIVTFLLGIAYSLRLLQATKATDGGWLIRLSPLGRWLIGESEHLPAAPIFKQTLLVQPNLEILAYRQGLTLELIARLTKIATWKGLGPACTLQLEPYSVYRALEMGESLTSIEQLLEGHGIKAAPMTVLDSLKTWSSKRERITIYSAGAIFEFVSASEMNEAIARGLPAVRLTDRLAIVANENNVEYKNFRLTGTRDYMLPPEKCVDIEADGVTLSVDLARSDLLLETELQRFAETIEQANLVGKTFISKPRAHYSLPHGEEGRVRGLPPTTQGRRYYRVTPASILSARQHGVTLGYLGAWFRQRTGLPISAAVLLLVTGPDTAPVQLQRQLVLQVGNEHLADGLQQWPGTRDLIVARLGPVALAVDEKDVRALVERLKEAGVRMILEG
jgi:hypothetical protein